MRRDLYTREINKSNRDLRRNVTRKVDTNSPDLRRNTYTREVDSSCPYLREVDTFLVEWSPFERETKAFSLECCFF